MIGASWRRRWAVALVALVLVGGASAESPSVIHAPTVTGVTMEGETLQAHGGVWTGEPPFTYTFDWQRCNNGRGDCVLIGVPKSEFYTLTAADIGYRIRTWVTVTGQDCAEWNTEKIRHCAPATRDGPSEQTEIVVANPKYLPANATAPAVLGTAEEGETLRADDGRWTGLEPLVILRQWERCEPTSRRCEAIPNAVEETYTLGAGDVGRTIRVAVTAKNVRGISAPVPSAPTTTVAALLPSPGRTTIDVAKVVPPYRLVIDRVLFEPTPVRARVSVTARVRVSDSRGFRVRGAVVRVAGVRPGVIGAVPDAVTGADGWAAVRLLPTARVAFRAGGAIGLRIRALGPPNSGVEALRRVMLPLGAPRR